MPLPLSLPLSRNRRSTGQGGGVLVWILIAVALFAALSYAMMRDSGSGMAARTMSAAQARLAATEIVAYGSEMRRAVQKLRIRGCGETELDFGNTVWTRGTGALLHPPGHNDGAPATGCSVFAPDDGGLQPKILPASYIVGVLAPGSQAPGHGRIYRHAFPGLGQPDKEEISIAFLQLDAKICMKINELLGIPNPEDSAPQLSINEAGNAYTYHGPFADTGIITDITGVLGGKAAFCAEEQSTSSYSFRQVLLVR
ncbi:MAG: hypothetical protein WC989_06290 [Micavibrio sp.]